MTLSLFPPTYRLLPYERDLMSREIRALDLHVLSDSGDRVVVREPTDLSGLSRLTYVERAESSGGVILRPDLAVIEAAHHCSRQRSAGRQATRYHLHGIHEYKGKFNPQVVRAFANVLDLRAEDWLLDPFCGSGTALLEGLSLAANVLGIDASPMAVYLSRAKVAAVRAASPECLADTLVGWIESSRETIDEAQSAASPVEEGLAHLDAPTRRYLEAWFTPPALAGLSAALDTRRGLTGACAALAGVAISSVCRAVSLQMPEDLRVRRRRAEFVAPSLSAVLQEAITDLARSLIEVSSGPRPSRRRARVVYGSASCARSYRTLRGRHGRCIVITSPPYASALPYIDTDRLSIALLGLSSGADLQGLEQTLVGSREWTAAEARAWNRAVSDDRDGLPAQVVAVCREVAADGVDAGFRRRAVAGLLYRYFVNMRAALAALRAALRAGEQAIFIVGTNRTSSASGVPTRIDTPKLLADVAAQVGFDINEIVPLDAWPRFGLHHANGIHNEAAVWLVATQRSRPTC